VLTPYLYEYDDGTVEFYLTENLVVQTLDSVPGLRTLRLETHESRVVERMLPHLTNLEVFSYKWNCTDEVIKQLGLHCHNLKEMYLSGCSRVTKASVQHLLRLRKLEILELDGTKIDNGHYCLLLSELQIRNIRFSPPHENILHHVADRKLHKISHVTDRVEDISMLAERCPNITNMCLDLYTNSHDLSCLAALTTLSILRLERGVYAKSNLYAVLYSIGPRLTVLTLDSMDNVNLHDIVTLCHSLESLSLVKCILLPFDPNTPLDPQLPHFRKLTSLCLVKHPWLDMNHNYFRHYVSLKTIRLASINVFTVKFIRKCVRSGTLANLEEICVRKYPPGTLNMEALELLIKHCPHLKTIEGLGHYPLSNKNVIEELKRRILAQNLDLQIKESRELPYWSLFILSHVSQTHDFS
jgi:hypothetical protein